MSRLIIWPSMMLLGWTDTKLWTLKHGSKSIQTSLILRQHPSKPDKLLKFFISSVTTVESCHAPTIWKKLRWKSLRLPIVKSITEIMKNVKSLFMYGFEGCCLKIRDICVDFEPYFKVHNLVSIRPKSIILGQMINLDMIFHVVLSVYRLVKIWNSPQFPVEFRNGLLFSVRFHYFLLLYFNKPYLMCTQDCRNDVYVSRYLILTAVNWSWHWCTSNNNDVPMVLSYFSRYGVWCMDRQKSCDNHNFLDRWVTKFSKVWGSTKINSSLWKSWRNIL